MSRLHPIFSEILCSFTMHEWKLTKRGVFYNFFKCKVCEAERIEPN